MAALHRDENGRLVQVVMPDFANIQNVTVGGASVPTTNVIPKNGNAIHPLYPANDLRMVMLISTTACWFNVGSAPVAAKDNTSIFLPAFVYFYIPVRPAVDKVAFIQDSAGGTAQVIPAL